MTIARRAFASLLAVLLLSACHAKDAVRVRLTFDAPPGSPSLTRVTVFAGANKSSWPTIAPGESVSVVLPPEGEPPDLSVTYTLGPAPHQWRGPSRPAGVGYAIAVRIAGDGMVTERHCQSPCEMP